MNIKNYLGRFFQNCIHHYHNVEHGKLGRDGPVPCSSLGSSKESAISMRFMQANGGTVINTNKYDPIKDRNYENLYIVVEGQDLAQEISKILMIENLR